MLNPGLFHNQHQNIHAILCLPLAGARFQRMSDSLSFVTTPLQLPTHNLSVLAAHLSHPQPSGKESKTTPHP